MYIIPFYGKIGLKMYKAISYKFQRRNKKENKCVAAHIFIWPFIYVLQILHMLLIVYGCYTVVSE